MYTRTRHALIGQYRATALSKITTTTKPYHHLHSHFRQHLPNLPYSSCFFSSSFPQQQQQQQQHQQQQHLPLRTTTSNIPPSDLANLNRTSAVLYRILLRSIRACPPVLLLQPMPSPSDYGRARLLDADRCAIWNRRSRKRRRRGEVDLDGKRTTTTRVEDEEEEEEMKMQSEVPLEALAFFRRWKDRGECWTNLRDQTVVCIEKKKEEEDEGDGYFDEWDFYPDRTVWVSRDDLLQALRLAFVRLVPSSSSSSTVPPSSPFVLTKAHIVDLHRFAIDSAATMEEQRRVWEGTSVSTDYDRGIQVVATSSYLGSSESSNNIYINVRETFTKPKHRFAYRIRIEKFSPYHDSDNTPNIDDDDNHHAVQLLGREWNIYEDNTTTTTNTNTNTTSSTSTSSSSSQNTVVTVRAPTTGVVGHLPVLHNGEIFEYVSGCELQSETGTMDGRFHMAWVEEGTKSARVGDPVEALEWEKNVEEEEKGTNGKEERLFEVTVAPFRLDAEEGVWEEE